MSGFFVSSFNVLKCVNRDFCTQKSVIFALLLLNHYIMSKTLFDLFNILHDLGEMLEGDVHIIDISESPYDDVDKKYRIYHARGYCIDIGREYCCEPDQVSEYEGVYEDGYNYTYFCEWDGFVSLMEDDVLNVMQDFINKLNTKTNA